MRLSLAKKNKKGTKKEKKMASRRSVQARLAPEATMRTSIKQFV